MTVKYKRDEFTECYNACKRRGMNLVDTANEMGLHPSSVYARARNYGIFEKVADSDPVKLKNRSGKKIIGHWELDFDDTKKDEISGMMYVKAVNVTGVYGGSLPERYMPYLAVRQMEKRLQQKEAVSCG